jgi:hypothetical protein
MESELFKRVITFFERICSVIGLIGLIAFLPVLIGNNGVSFSRSELVFGFALAVIYATLREVITFQIAKNSKPAENDEEDMFK